MSLKAVAAAQLPDRLVPQQERTAVSQEQERAALSSAASATASSLKSECFHLGEGHQNILRSSPQPSCPQQGRAERNDASNMSLGLPWWSSD